MVVVEDLICSGGCWIRGVEGLEEGGGNVVGVVGILTYGVGKGEKRFNKVDIGF